MGIINNLFSSANRQNEISVDMSRTTSSLVRSGSGSSVNMTEEKAMSVAALYQGVSIIADTIASMPVYLHKETDGFQQIFKNDYRSKALSGMANDVLTSYNFKRNIIKDLILYGNSYGKIERIGTEQIKLWYLNKENIQIKKDNSGYYMEVKGYSTDVSGEKFEAEIVDFYDALIFIRNPKFNSVTGQGILDYAANILDLSSNETGYMLNLFKNGLSAKSVLSSKTPFKKEIKEQLKADLQNFYSGVDNAGKILVLEGDVSVQPLALTPSDIKIIESKNLSVTEISRYLNIPKHMLGLDRGSGTYSNITQERLSLYQNALTPFTVILEETLNQKLLTEEELEQGYYFQCDISEILKLTPEDQATYMINLFDKNIVTVEEVRTALNLGGNEEIINELKAIQDVKTINATKTIENENVSDETNITKKEKEEVVE